MLENSRWREEIRRQLDRLGLPPAREAEIVEELSQHLEDEYRKALACGASEEEARQQVIEGLSGGKLLAEELAPVEQRINPEPIVPGKARGISVFRDLWQDVRYATRILRKNPGFTALAVLSLALGIGGNAAMFSIVSAVLIRPLPYPEPERLVRAANDGYYPPGGLVALQRQSRTMDVSGYMPTIDLNLTGQDGVWRLTGSSVSANLFTVLGVEAELGRAFRNGDDQPGKDNLVILSHTLWLERFDGDPGVIGRVITFGGVGRQVVGVMPPRFAFPDAAARFWIPLDLDPRDENAYWAHGFMPVVARVRPGATLAQAQNEIRSLSRQMLALFPYPMGSDFNAQSTVIPLQEFLVTNVRARLIVLQCAISLVLLIACANVANLLLARASSRQKEMALRAALGAARGRIVRQLLTESVLLAFAGGAVGVLLAGWSASALKLVLPADAISWPDFSIGWQVLLFASALSVVTGLAFGLAPALTLFGYDLAGMIKTGGPRSMGTARARFRSALIVAEVALAVVLSVGAGLLVQTLWRLAQVNPGFQPQQVFTLRVSPDQSLCNERSRCIALYDEVLRRAQSIPRVYEVAAANTLPLSNDVPSLPVVVQGRPYVPSEHTAPLFWAGAVTPAYFRLMHIPILEGRGLTAGDGERSEPVIVVSAATAQYYWPGQNPIGKHIRPVFENAWRTVVGVAGDVRQYDLANHAPNYIGGALYMPYSQAVENDRQLPASMTLIVRIGGDPSGVVSGIHKLVHDLNPNVPISEVRAMESLVDASTQQSRSMAGLFASFAGIALLLAAIGTYGVVSWSTAQRAFEIGLRVALGAPRRSVFTLVLGQSLRLVISGLALGVAASFALTHALSAFLYATASWDAFTFSGVSVLLLAVALLAGYFPARRAANVDPLTALRIE
jgi:putative ABC transport system permease protein